MNSIPQKVCTKCGHKFPATPEYFHRSKNNKSGIIGQCKNCRNDGRVAKQVLTGNKITKREKTALAAQGLKRCSKCREVYPLSSEHFFRTKQQKDGLNTQCKRCCTVWREENREHYIEYHRQYYYGNHDTMLEKARATRERHAERAAAYRIVYYYANRERLLDQKKDYARRHAEAIANRSRQRRARQKGAEGTHTPEDVERIRRSQNGNCWWCGKKIEGKGHIDHRIPLVRGGGNDASNLVISCPTCNMRKGKKLPSEFRGRLF